MSSNLYGMSSVYSNSRFVFSLIVIGFFLYDKQKDEKL